MANGTILDISAKSVGVAAAFVFVVFMVGAYCLYQHNFGHAAANSAYLLKVADSLINGAIVGVLLAMLRALFELPKLLFSSSKQ